VAHGLERRALRQRRESGADRRYAVVRRAHLDAAVEIEQHRDGRPNSTRLIEQRRANRRVIARRNGLLEPEVGNERVHGREQLLVAVVDVLIEQDARESDLFLGALVDVGADRVENGE